MVSKPWDRYDRKDGFEWDEHEEYMKDKYNSKTYGKSINR